MLNRLGIVSPFRKAQQQQPIEVRFNIMILHPIYECKFLRKKSQMVKKNESNGIDRLNSFFH
jgi:hypothetical protein